MNETIHKYGDRRRDGMRFVQYYKSGGRFLETWLKPDAWERGNQRRLARNRAYKARLKSG